jgi:hypothetical protein
MTDETTLVPTDDRKPVIFTENKPKVHSQVKFRDEKIATHYGDEKKSLAKIVGNEPYNGEELLRLLVNELLREVDNLAGSQIIATENGDFQTATIISAKRTEIVDRAIKAIMHKKEFEAQTSIDIESPFVFVIFKYFIEKCKEAFTNAGFNNDTMNPFFYAFDDATREWKKDLKKRIVELKT